MKNTKKTIILIITCILLICAVCVSSADTTPMITSWYNSKTGDNSTSFTVEVDETIMFNVSANQENVTWVWTVNGEDLGEVKDTLELSFEKYGTYNISVYGSDENYRNNATRAIYWNVTSVLSVTDDLGYSMDISKKPQRIVSLSPSNTEILFALGLDDSIVGVTDYCDYPADAKEKEKVGSYVTPSVELIVEMNPDLILASRGNEMDVLIQLKSLNYTVFGLNPQSLEGIVTSINTVGTLTQEEERASKITEDMHQRIDAIEDKTISLSDTQKLSVLYVVWHDPLYVAGTETFANDLIKKAGGINIASELNGW